MMVTMEHPMCRFLGFLVLAGLVLVPLISTASAQNQEGPLVLFVSDAYLNTASPLHTGAGGLSELERIFQNLGARTQYADVSERFPEDARVLVIFRPSRPLPATYLARIWEHVTNGNHLLLAIDPEGYNGALPDNSNSGLNHLLSLDYGVGILDMIAVDPWFTQETIADPLTAYSHVLADDATRHPVVEPLITYDLPVQTWGARAIEVNAFGPGGYGVPLLISPSSYGRPSVPIFSNDGEPISLAINPAVDQVGQMIIGALAENTETGSRIVVLGDSEIGQNGFGLAHSIYTAGTIPPSDAYPLHVGNRILIERLSAWLLELPLEDWPVLPSGFTWLALDGMADEWTELAPLVSDDVDTSDSSQHDIVDVKAFHDDCFLYVLIETIAPPAESVGVTLNLSAGGNDGDELALLITENAITMKSDRGTSTVITDGDMALGEALEIRLPLRLTGEKAALADVCLCVLCDEAATEPIDCATMAPAEVPETATRAPVNVRSAEGMLVTVASSTTVNLREEPAISSLALAGIPNGYVFEAIGRDRSGDWIQVQDARYLGWIASYLLVPNGDLLSLGVVEMGSFPQGER